jgi:flagellar hook-associated protein 3 FlgL
MRVTTSMLFRSALSDLGSLKTRMAATQEQASSGRRINRPSDDPSGAGMIRQLETQLEALRQFERNISGTRGRLAASEAAVANSVDVMIRARELAISGANGTLDATTRMQIATEVESLHGGLLAESNAKLAGGHLFSGFASDTAPFVSTGSFSSTPPGSPVVGFVGDSNEIQVDIEDGVRVPASFDGRTLFMGDANGDGVPDPGRDDGFDVLADLHDALMANDPVAVAAALPRIDAVLDQLQIGRTRIGATEGRLSQAEQRVSNRIVQAEIRLSEVRDADLAEVISTLARDENALTASLQTMGRLLPPSLMDFLR